MYKLSLAAALLLLTSAIGFGQTGLASITGTVTDASGAVISDASILVRNLENGSEFKTVSSSTGNYTVSQLPIGDYDLSVTSPGFKGYTHSRFHLASAQVMREDLQLEVGQTSESV